MKKYVWLQKSIIPTIILSVFLFHAWSSRQGQLSPWKGGGFGMYTEVHWFNNQIWVGTRNGTFSGDSLYNILKGKDKRLYGRIKRNPTHDALYLLGDLIHRSTQLEEFFIQVWKPTVSGSTYHRKLINEIYYRK